jgi:hypothetical protein
MLTSDQSKNWLGTSKAVPMLMGIRPQGQQVHHCGFREFVVSTSSRNLVHDGTESLKAWAKSDWKEDGGSVADQDLWKEMLRWT